MKQLMPLVFVVAVAACNSEPEVDVKNASPDEVAGKVAAARGSDSFVRPGRWQTTFRLEEMTMPGVPAQVAEQMKSQMNTAETSESCLTEADVKKPKEDFFAGNQRNCTYDHFTMAGGTIDAEMTCKEGGATMNMTVKGTYGPDNYSARSTMLATGPGANGGGMKMTSTIEAKRLGECTKG